MEWTDRFAEAVAERVASRLAAALRGQPAPGAPASRTEELLVEFLRSQEEMIRLLEELARTLKSGRADGGGGGPEPDRTEGYAG